MPSILNSDSGAVTGSAGLKFTAGDDGILEIQNSGSTAVKLSDSFLKVPTGSTAQRPASPENGMIRFNSDTGELEGYLGGAWKTVAGNEPALKLDFDQYQMDSRISFTRATNGTYFDSAGVLRTAGSGVPRFDHMLEGGVWVNKGLLIEEARTNLSLRSEEFNDTAWVKDQTTVTANQTTAPDGTTTADAVFETTVNTFHYIRGAGTNINATSSPFTASIFIKANGRTTGLFKLGFLSGSFQEISVVFNLSSQLITSTGASSGGLVQGSSLTNVGNGWYRITLSGYTGQNGSHALQVFLRNDTGASFYAGDTSKGLYLWGAQLEAGAFPTSYIATTSASVTRNADVASMTSTNFSSWYNQSEGTVFWQGDTVKANRSSGYVARSWYISDGTANERLVFSFNVNDEIGQFFVGDGNVTQAQIFSPDPTISIVGNQTYKFASAYKLNDFAHTSDGRAPGTDTSGTLPTVNRLDIGTDLSGSSNFLNGHIAKFYYWPTRQPNAKLVSLTQ
jgi:hypothetical protein